MARDNKATIVRKMEVVEGGGHHGGSWKVAYADFMTAMMAFFLLMWILSSSDEQKLRGIAEYFTDATLPGGSGVLDGATLGPPGTLSASNGAVVARGSDLGKIDQPTPAQWEVRDTTATADPQERIPGSNEGVHDNPAAGFAVEVYETKASDQATGQRANRDDAESEDASVLTSASGVTELEAVDTERFAALQKELMQAMEENPDLRPLKKNVIFEQTPEGLRIQLIDQKGQPMFDRGSAEMIPAARQLVAKLGESLKKLPNPMVLTGHTDSVPFTNRKSYDNWDLSTDRANATRRVLLSSGVIADRFIRVAGKADTEPLLPETPNAAPNRRITMLLRYRVAPSRIGTANEDGDGQIAPDRHTSEKSEKTPAASGERQNFDHEVAHSVPTAIPASAAKHETESASQQQLIISESALENLRNVLR